MKGFQREQGQCPSIIKRLAGTKHWFRDPAEAFWGARSLQVGCSSRRMQSLEEDIVYISLIAMKSHNIVLHAVMRRVYIPPDAM